MMREMGSVRWSLEDRCRETGREFKSPHLYIDAKDFSFSSEEEIDTFAQKLKDQLSGGSNSSMPNIVTKEFSALFELYKAYQDGHASFDKDRNKKTLDAILLLATLHGVIMESLDEEWRSYRKALCKNLGDSIGNPGIEAIEYVCWKCNKGNKIGMSGVIAGAYTPECPHCGTQNTITIK